eukprot:6894654-Pyramimonas_sp.AAC.1
MRGTSQALRVGPEWALRPRSAHSSMHGSPHWEGAQIMERFCTYYAAPPKRDGAALVPGARQDQLAKQITESVKIFGTDAAADELAAVKSLGPQGVDTLVRRYRAYLPNLVCQVRGPTHAARRTAGYAK